MVAKLKVGMTVEAKYRSAKRFFPAKIVRYSHDSTFALRFDWGNGRGELVDGVDRADIRLSDSRQDNDGSYKDVFEISEVCNSLSAN